MKGLGMDKVKKISLDGWIFYMSEDKSNLDQHKCGKWMHFFNNKEFAVHICEEAVANGICVEAKHTDA